MSDKPTEVADWTPTGADVITPAAGEKTSGFQSSQRPPAEYVNWFWELVTQWIVWISNGYFTRPSLTDNTPVVAFTDRDGNERTYVGPEGYFMGPAIQELHRWTPVDVLSTLTTGSQVSASGMKVILDTNTSARVISGLSGATTTGAPGLKLSATGSAANQRAMVLSEYAGGSPSGNQPVSDIDNNVVVMEYAAYISTATLTGIECYSGLHNFNAFAATTLALASNRFAYFLGAAGSANWRCYVANGSSGSNVDSGVAVVANAYSSFRIEYHGANSPVGVDAGGAVVRFFIDGAEVAEITTANVPSGLSSLGGFHAIAGNSPASSRDYVIRPTRLAWTEVLSPDVPA